MGELDGIGGAAQPRKRRRGSSACEWSEEDKEWTAGCVGNFTRMFLHIDPCVILYTPEGVHSNLSSLGNIQNVA
jgi:hypothetical protein